MQFISSDEKVRSDTVQDIKEFNSQALSTQAKKGELLVFKKPALKKYFDLMGDDIVELSIDFEYSKKIGSYDENQLQESIAKLLKQNDDEIRVKIIMSRMEKQFRNYTIWLIYLMIKYGVLRYITTVLQKIRIKILF